MMRRSDSFINATHILKVADHDKPARTRILEREVQKGIHEKVQGGYGKYQGTWIPLADGRLLAERNGVLDKMRPMFDFVPGDRSPPPAPKHATATSNRSKAPRQSAAAAAAAAAAAQAAATAARNGNHDYLLGSLNCRRITFFVLETIKRTLTNVQLSSRTTRSHRSAKMSTKTPNTSRAPCTAKRHPIIAPLYPNPCSAART
jgi:hypothetical protein